MLNRTLDLGTDVAAFFVFHPDDLAHRKDAPIDWYTYEFAVAPEFVQGSLIAFSTGSDGGYRLRLTEEELTEAERKLEVGSWAFRYLVRDGRTFVDNSDSLPSEDQMDDPDKIPDRWITLPNGNYRVTVHALARAGEDGEEIAGAAELPDYVVRFEQIADLNTIAPPTTMPELVPWRGQEPRLSPGISADGPDKSADSEPLRDSYPLLETASAPAPGAGKTLTIPVAFYELLQSHFMSDNEQEEIRDIVLAPSAEPGIGTLARVYGLAYTEGEKIGEVTVSGVRLVQVTGPAEGEQVAWVRAEPVHREEAPLSEAEMAALKADFDAYAQENSKYRKHVKHPDFERDRVTAMTSSTALTSCLLQHVQMTPTQRRKLLPLSDTERAEGLRSLLHAA